LTIFCVDIFSAALHAVKEWNDAKFCAELRERRLRIREIALNVSLKVLAPADWPRAMVIRYFLKIFSHRLWKIYLRSAHL